jgi:hypothetical protein
VRPNNLSKVTIVIIPKFLVGDRESEKSQEGKGRERVRRITAGEMPGHLS